MTLLQASSIARLVVAGTFVSLVAGCTSTEGMFASDKVDYRGGATRTQTLDIPPDLSQLARDGRYAPQSGTVSASTFQTGASGAPAASTAAATAAAGAAAIAPTSVGEFRYLRNGNQRWLATTMPVEKVWPQLRAFWEERGFAIKIDSAEAGILETDWAENRAKLPDDIIRRTLGRILDSFYSTGERDKFRTRIERSTASNGAEIFVTHFGLVEELQGPQKDRTVWTSRANDPQLEAEFLQRMMVKLGAKPEEAKAIAATPTAAGGARARALTGQATSSLQVDDNFDRAWRRVGVALDRNGFTVEDRDRAAGTYFVRYADPRNAAADEPNFFARLFGATDSRAPARYRVNVKGDGERSVVAIANAQGAPETGEVGKRIVELLVEELR